MCLLYKCKLSCCSKEKVGSWGLSFQTPRERAWLPPQRFTHQSSTKCPKFNNWCPRLVKSHVREVTWISCTFGVTNHTESTTCCLNASASVNNKSHSLIVGGQMQSTAQPWAWKMHRSETLIPASPDVKVNVQYILYHLLKIPLTMEFPHKYACHQPGLQIKSMFTFY